MRWALAIMVAGCGFEHGALPPRDVGSDQDTTVADVPVDVASQPTACHARWLAGTMRFDAGVAIATVNSTGYDRDPFVSLDELTLYLSSARAGTSGGGDVWIAKRSTLSSQFPTPVEASEFNSTAEESKLVIVAQDRIAMVASDRLGSVGADIWESIRASTSTAWPAMNRTNLAMVNTAGYELDPTLSVDGQRLYLAMDVAGQQKIGVAVRGVSNVFGAATVITELDSGTGDADPALSVDERVMLFASNRRAGGNADIWYSTRSSLTSAFAAPLLVPDVATDAPEGDPHLSSDSCRIYFARSLGNDNYDIFVATMQPL